ncbi:hypothetical protein M8C21_019022 [Ambrosia artemisiifolia]|uniref:50S ribosomal protein L18 n=1 Tax=Ambrosia artemisiifolia TaxID=4212 RepID=A0AAD5C020_AMBAR|nr:hypothetical protein M8C21_019022 [Ambrosia artemisiifolia]
MLWTKPPKLLCNSSLVFDSPTPNRRFDSSGTCSDMVIPPPVKAQRITSFLKPYLLRMHFSNQFVSAQVIHAPTATVAAAASSQEKALREAWTKSQQSTRDVSAAAKIGKILGERLLVNDIPAVSVVYKKNQRYHGKVRAVIDSLREAGVKLL